MTIRLMTVRPPDEETKRPMSETTFYRHAPRHLIGDYFRAVFGLAVTLAVLFSLEEPVGVVGAIFLILALLFFAFALRTLRQHLLHVAINDEGIFTKVVSTTSLPWSKLTDLMSA